MSNVTIPESMQLTPFLKHFEQTASADCGAMTSASVLRQVDADFVSCLEQLGGKTFRHGLYRVFRGDQIEDATSAIQRVFPEYRENIVAFGYDWLGRHFAIDKRRMEGGRPLVLMLEVGTGQAMQIPVPIMEFHNTELVEYADDALAQKFFQQWRAVHSDPIDSDHCVGYKIPLFLGGSDTLDNLELIDLSVYVEICGQLRNKIKTLPAGQTIKDVVIA